MGLSCFESDYLRRVILSDLESNKQIKLSLENYKAENETFESANTNMKILEIKSEIKIAHSLLEKL